LYFASSLPQSKFHKHNDHRYFSRTEIPFAFLLWGGGFNFLALALALGFSPWL
jgi:hypothetical protein